MKKKLKISISVNEQTLERIDEIIEKGQFRNRSHAFEYSLHQILNDSNLNINNKVN
ncbi:MAG TPA: ribbon-helix-helix domain-containing protein [Candidatus Paceibacterota bacterium]|nr:ribbon-helix-helix domain-containing protein [Candidatus Paceibacterota bacterium]